MTPTGTKKRLVVPPEFTPDKYAMHVCSCEPGESFHVLMTKQPPHEIAVLICDGCGSVYKHSNELMEALEDIVKLQAHYAELLNIWDGGHRIKFKNAEDWLARRRELEKKT